MLLDTGAAQTALDLETAESLGDGRTSKTPCRVGGFGGEQEVRTLRSVTIQLGNARQEHFGVPAFSMKGLSGIVGYRVSGLLGTSFLQHVILWINYRDGWVRILPAERRSRRDRAN